MKTTPVAVSYGKFRAVSAIAIAVALILFSIHFSSSSESKAAVQPTALGKLAYDRTDFTTGGVGYIALASANSDGTGQTTLASAGVPPIYNNNAAWNSLGTKIAYESDNDIWVMNADGSGKINLTTNGPSPSESNPSWSISGKIAYERGGQIWTMNEDGGGQSVFSAITQATPTAPAWSPDGSKLAFASGGDIWVINSDGTGERRLKQDSPIDADPAWTPDGNKLVYSKDILGIMTIFLDGTGETRLTVNPGDGKPAVSNDGTKIAFVRRGTSANGIYVMNAVGSHQIRILADNPINPGRTEHNNPTWQPVAVTPNTSIISGRITRNGESLAGVLVNLSGAAAGSVTTNSLGEYRFENLARTGNYTITPNLGNHLFTPARRFVVDPTSNRIADFTAGQTCSTPGCRVNGKLVFVRGTDIFVSNADGTGVTNLTSGTMGICEEPAFSPDGNFITFRSNSPGNYEIYRMTLAGSSVTRLTNATGEDKTPVYSPDGTKIAFVSARDGNDEIYSMNADGTNQQRLTNNTIRDGEPAFSPDGTKIVFNRGTNWQLFTLNSSDGSGSLQITSPPAGSLDMTPSYSPDGTKIIFTRYDSGPFTSVFITINPDGTGATTLSPTGFVRKASYSPDGTKIVYTRVGLSGQPSRLEIGAMPSGSGATVVEGYNADWQPVRPATRPTQFDFDGDGRSDVAVFRPSDGVWYILRSSDLSVQQQQFAIAGDMPVPTDLDGDGRTDIAIHRPSNGDFWSLSSISNQQINFNLGQAGDVPMPSDIDGDGRSDYVVYRPSNGNWYRVGSSSGIASTISFGATGDRPMVGDFDGDGLNDPAIYRPSDGNWWWRASSDGVQRAAKWGLAEDIPAPADYDGDGRTDLAVYRPSTGVWYMYSLSSTTSTIFPFGLNGDKPVVADYDGDGRADAAVYRPSDGIWYLLRSNAGFTGFRWGLSSDVPIPNSFIR